MVVGGVGRAQLLQAVDLDGDADGGGDVDVADVSYIKNKVYIKCHCLHFWTSKNTKKLLLAGYSTKTDIQPTRYRARYFILYPDEYRI